MTTSESQERARSSRSSADNPRRQHILRAAAACFAELGYDRTTVEVIAARAEVSRPTVYAYFSSRDEVFRGVTDHVCERFLEAQHVEHETSEDLRQILAITTDAFIRAVYEFGDLLAVIEHRARVDATVGEQWRSVHTRLVKRYARFVTRIVDTYDAAPSAPPAAIAELLADAQLTGAARIASASKRKRTQYISTMVAMSERLIGLSPTTTHR